MTWQIQVKNHMLYFHRFTLRSKYVLLFTQQNISCFEDVFKTSWRRLQRNTFRFPRLLQDVFAIRLPQTSSRRLRDMFARRLAIRSSRPLQDVFARRLEIMSSRRLQDVFKTIKKDKKMLQWTRLRYVFTKTNDC